MSRIRVNRSFVAALLLAPCVSWSRAGAQGWEARFPPAAGCTPTLARAVAADRDAPSGTLVVRTLDFAGSRVEGAQLDVRAAGADTARAPARAVSDTAGRARFPDLVPGAYLLTVRRIGFGRDTATVVVRAGSADTVTVSLQDFNDEYRNVHNCRPRGFRRAGERACVTEPEQADIWVSYARNLLEPGQRTLISRVPKYRARDVELVTDERICERAGRAYGGEESPPRRIIVVRVGRSYMVHDPFEPLTAGEWDITVFFDHDWRQISGIAG